MCDFPSFLRATSQFRVEEDGVQLFFCLMVLAFLDFHGILVLSFQITGQARVLLWSATRCAKDSSVGLSAQKRSAVPQWAEPGATPVRCVPLSLTPAVVASFQTFAQERVKVKASLVGLLMGDLLCFGEPFSRDVQENGKAVLERNSAMTSS
jgi:small neutral amino acid transporter SnatA (MarC family)